MKLIAITICKNEEFMLPFYFRHYEPFIDEFVFFDNGSEDRTLELINARSDTRVVPFDTVGYQKEEINTVIRNSAYRELHLDGDWYFNVDVDEMLYHPDLRAYLERCQQEGYTYIPTVGYNMYAESAPEDDGQTSLLAHIRHGIRDDVYSKASIVSPRVRINYSFGSHHCYPEGEVKRPEKAEVKLLHYRMNWIGKVAEGGGKYRHYRLSQKTNELIPRGATTRVARVLSREECLRFKLPVFDEELAPYAEDVQQRAANGDEEAAHLMGLMYYYGQPFDVDLNRAREWLTIAALGECAYSCYHLGHLYLMGKGVSENVPKALQWFVKGGELGNADAAFVAGWLYLYNESVRNLEQGFHFLHLAAERKHREAKAELGLAYGRKELGRHDLAKAEQWRLEAADEGDILSLHNHAADLYNKKQYAEAFPYFRQAAEKGGRGAYEVLDGLLKHGLGIPEDYEGSEEWYAFRLKRALGPI